MVRQQRNRILVIVLIIKIKYTDKMKTELPDFSWNVAQYKNEYKKSWNSRERILYVNEGQNNYKWPWQRPYHAHHI